MAKQSHTFNLAAVPAQKIASPADLEHIFAAMQGDGLRFAFQVSSFEKKGMPGLFKACVWTDLSLEAVENDAWRAAWSKVSHTDYVVRRTDSKQKKKTSSKKSTTARYPPPTSNHHVRRGCGWRISITTAKLAFQ